MRSVARRFHVAVHSLHCSEGGLHIIALEFVYMYMYIHIYIYTYARPPPPVQDPPLLCLDASIDKLL